MLDKLSLDKLNQIGEVIKKILLAIVSVIGIAMLVIAWLHVFCRHVLNNSLTWSEELLRILLIWFALFCVSFISAKRGHVSVIAFRNLLPDSLNELFMAISSLLMYLSSLMMVYIGIRMIIKSVEQKTPALGIPYIWLYLSVPVSFLFISFFEFRNLVRALQKYKNGTLIEDAHTND